MASTENEINFENYAEIHISKDKVIIVCTIPLEHGIKRTMVIDKEIQAGFSSVTTDSREAYNDFLTLGKIFRHAVSSVKEEERKKPLLRVFQERILHFLGGERRNKK